MKKEKLATVSAYCPLCNRRASRTYSLSSAANSADDIPSRLRLEMLEQLKREGCAHGLQLRFDPPPR